MDLFPLPKISAPPTIALFPARKEEQKTVCILGVPRGGTSMVAGILRKLGVFMGENINSPNNEDYDFLSHNGRRHIFTGTNNLLEKQSYLRSAVNAITNRNNEFSIWGWKDPICYTYIRDLLHVLRNPVFIFVTRDLAAAAQREIIEEGAVERERVLLHLNLSLEAYASCVELINQLKRPTLIVSYERALRASIEIGQSVQHFLGITPPQDFKQWLEGYIIPDRLDGAIDILKPDQIQALQYGSTSLVRGFLSESMRVRREGFLSESFMTMNNPDHQLFSEATSLLYNGYIEQGARKALELVASHVPQLPQLADGPLGVLAHNLIAEGPISPYPDLVCGAFYLCGIASLLGNELPNAVMYFLLTEKMMMERLLSEEGKCTLSLENYLSSIFHLGVSAKATRRLSEFEAVKSYFAGKPIPRFVSKDRFADFAVWQRRAALEL